MNYSYNLQSLVESVGVAARRDYVFSNTDNPIALGSLLSTSVSLEPKLPWVMFGFRINSLVTTTGGKTVTAKDLRLNIQDAEQRFFFTDPVMAATLGTGNFGYDPYTINPLRIFPPGGAIYMQFYNQRVDANIGFEVLFMGYEVANAKDIKQR